MNNPVLMLDEIDKLGRDYRGDPAAALLEILDPAQNNTFRDNYLDLPFDLSNVFFITTANALDPLPAPLLDRLEMLRLSGYSEGEKVEIARRYLIPRQVKETGLPDGSFHLPDETIRLLAARYTREAGVRQLEQPIGRLARKIAVRFAEGTTESGDDRPGRLERTARRRSDSVRKQARKQLPPGVATGLAWTEAGGDVLYIEATLLPGVRKLKLTGQLGEVMKESAAIARSLMMAQAPRFGIDPLTVRRSRRPHPRAGGRRAEGRPERRRGHGDGTDLALHKCSRSPRHGHDRRDHAHGPGAADRRREGKSPGRQAGRDHAGGSAKGEREGPERSARTGSQRNDFLSGGVR